MTKAELALSLLELRPGEELTLTDPQLASTLQLQNGDTSAGLNAFLAGLEADIELKAGTSGSYTCRKQAYAQPPTIGRWKGETAKNYLKDRLHTDGWVRENDVVELLLKQVPDGGKVLDVPFGTGRFVDAFHRKNMEVFGVDISPEMIAAAEAAVGDAFKRCDVRVASSDHLPFDDGTFDLLICVRLLTGILSFEVALATLREFRRVTQGQLILFLRNSSEAEDQSELTFERILHPGDRISANLSRSEIELILARAGFEVVDKHVLSVNDAGQEKTVYLVR